MTVVDLHAHVVLEEAFGAAGSYGPELGHDKRGVPFFRIGQYRMKPVDYRGTLFMDIGRRREQMAADGIDVQLLSPNPLTMFHHIPADAALAHCRVHNDAMAALVSEHGDAFLGTACLPMQDVDAAIDELERAVRDLGLVGAYTGTDYPFPLDDPRLVPFYEALVDLDVPLFLHPASTGGDAGPADPRLDRFALTILLGYPYEELLAVATLVLGGVLDRHPDLDVCISHGGGGIAYFADRFSAMFAPGRRLPPSIAEHGFEAALRGLWFDAHVDGRPARDRLVEVVGLDRLVHGTNFGGWEPSEPADDFAASLTPNAERLLRRDFSTTGETTR